MLLMIVIRMRMCLTELSPVTGGQKRAAIASYQLYGGNLEYLVAYQLPRSLRSQ